MEQNPIEKAIGNLNIAALNEMQQCALESIQNNSKNIDTVSQFDHVLLFAPFAKNFRECLNIQGSSRKVNGS